MAASKKQKPQVSVTDQGIALLRERRKAGIKTYGGELLTHNGRSALWDAIEEAADLYLYLLQAYIEVNGVRRQRRFSRNSGSHKASRRSKRQHKAKER